MQLVAQDFGEVMAALRSSIKRGGHERRSSARMEVQGLLTVYPYQGGQLCRPYTCLTRDLSFKGIGLLQSVLLASGSEVVVILPREDAPALAMLCTVTNCREVADGMYNVGASFKRVFDFETDARPSAPAAPAQPLPTPRQPVTSPAAIAPAPKPAARPAAKADKSSDEELERIRQSILS